jgi:putative sigma-54 modulation protein
MQISVTARHMEITDAIRDYATEKTAEELDSFSRIERVHMILDHEKYRHQAELVIQAKNHIRVDAHAESEDMYVSIDQAVEKAGKQLRRLRDKIQDHKSREKLAHVDLRMGPADEAPAAGEA